MQTLCSLPAMKKPNNENLVIGSILLALLFVYPAPATAGVDVDVNIALPPPIIFGAPPMVVVIPETYVYAVPDADVDIFFYNGWWWRPWDGRWYRSQHYESGWVYYQRVPSFYGGIPPGWRNDYRDRRWAGHEWNHQRIPHQELRQNWRTWEKNRHWEKENTWGVQGLKPRARAPQRSQAVEQKARTKPDVRDAGKPQPAGRESREVRSQQSRPQPQAVKPRQSRQPSGEVRPQRPQQQSGKAAKKSKSRQGKPDRGEEEKPGRRDRR